LHGTERDGSEGSLTEPVAAMSTLFQIDAAWMDQQVRAYAQHRQIYIRHTDLLQAVLQWLATPAYPTAMVTSRTKAIASFAGKIIKRVSNAGALPVTDKMQYELTPDLSAGRIVVHLQRQVWELEKRLSDVLEPTRIRHAETELNESQFGYRAVHVCGTLKIADLRKNGFLESRTGASFANQDLSEFQKITCEVQLVTMAQNLWDAFTHDRQYKSDFVLPRVWSRTAYRVAAVLEGVDEALEEIVEGLNLLDTNIGRYLDSSEAHAETNRLEAILRWSSDDPKTTARLVRLQTLLGRYDDVINRLDAVDIHLDPRLKSELGYALICRNTSTEADRARGLGLLQESSVQHPDVETLTRLAQLTECDDLTKRDLWRKAYMAKPVDPTALAGFLRHEMAYSHDNSVCQLLHPNITSARKTLEEQLKLRINLPNALFLLAQFDLMQDDPYPALYRLCRALSLTQPGLYGDEIISDIHADLLRLRSLRPEPAGIQWCLWTVEIYRAVRTAAGGPVSLPPTLKTLAGNSVTAPALFVAGGCDAADIDWSNYKPLLDFALTDYSGTIISGGTRSGIGAIVGDIIEKRPALLHGFCWLPPHLPTGTLLDNRYADVRCADVATTPAGFSPAEPLLAWMTILQSGIRPADVKLIGVNGGQIATFEYHFAALLGASVAVVRQSGRAADALLIDQEQPGNDRIRFLPADFESLRAFIDMTPRSNFNDAEIKLLAEQADASYHVVVHEQTRRAWDRKLAADPSLARTFSLSNISQIEHITTKLARIGLKPIKAADPTTIVPMEFNPQQVELLAEMEHGRWVAERTLAGWRLGPSDDARKLRPQLVAWSDPTLSNDEREKDRAAVRAIPKMLAAVGYRIEPAR
jgi:ppGpp synthetase/RelA/SpoT-type nucleotidyltranferase